MSNIPKLRDEHLRLLGTIRRMGALIERREPPPPLHLFALRHELSTTLVAHLEVEDGVLYPPLFNSPDSQIAATARAFSEEMGGLADAYRSIANDGPPRRSPPTGPAFASNAAASSMR